MKTNSTQKKIIAFGASNSRQSINKTLATFAANQLSAIDAQILDLNDFEMPIYSIDRENENGIHTLAKQFKNEILEADGIIISFAEHNSAYSAAFKNIYDWVSRMAPDVWEGKPMFLMATSPGEWGGKSVLKLAHERFSRRNSNTILTFSLPSFGTNYSDRDGIIDERLNKEFKKNLALFSRAL